MNLDEHIRRIPDFPKPGILFYDISTLLDHPQAWAAAVARMTELVGAFKPDLVAGIESRGFVFAAPVSIQLGTGMVLVRKLGKLPGTVVSHSYELEYGSDTLQLSDGLVKPGARIAIVDDLIATGGTAAATVELLRKVGAEVVGAAFLIELDGLGGADRLGVPVNSALCYPG